MFAMLAFCWKSSLHFCREHRKSNVTKSAVWEMSWWRSHYPYIADYRKSTIIVSVKCKSGFCPWPVQKQQGEQVKSNVTQIAVWEMSWWRSHSPYIADYRKNQLLLRAGKIKRFLKCSFKNEPGWVFNELLNAFYSSQNANITERSW